MNRGLRRVSRIGGHGGSQVRHLPAKINPTLAAEGQSQQALGRSPGPISKNACSDNFRGTE
jgi:hypothetical protein